MKTVDRRIGRPPGRGTRSREPRWSSPLAPGERSFEIALPSALKRERLPTGSSVALVEVDEKRLKLRFLRPRGVELEAPTLTSTEETLLAAGGVEPLSSAEARLVEAQMAADYQHLRDTSLSVGEAAQRLHVNASRIRQRLAEGSLYGIRDGSTWLLPEFQFTRDGPVPGIDAVLKKLPSDISPIAVVRWFNTPDPDLCTRDDQERPRTPLRWLLSGGSPEAAAELAADL
jgi:excisionase family DNA binding protein